MCENDFKEGQYELLFSIREVNSSDSMSKDEMIKETDDLMETLKKYYLPIKNAFLVLQSESSNQNSIAIKHFANFFASTGIFNEKYKAEDLAKCYMDSNLDDDDNKLSRCEFIGALLRIAIFKYKETGIE